MTDKATLNPNDDLTYTYSTYNSTSSNDHDLVAISVLPYDQDNRGTKGLDSTNPYKVTNLSLEAESTKRTSVDNINSIDSTGSTNSTSTNNTDSLPLPTLYFTTSNRARELASTNPDQLAMDNNGIDWQACELTMEATGNYTCSNLPTSSTTNQSTNQSTNPASNSTSIITAIKWQLSDFNSGSRYNVKLTIADINGLSNSILANNLTYVSTDSIGASTMAPIVEVTYLGESLGLAMDKDTLTATIKPNEVVTIPHAITITANTKSGYNLTVNTKDKDNSLVRVPEEDTDTNTQHNYPCHKY